VTCWNPEVFLAELPAYTGVGCPQDGVPVFSSIFTQNTIAKFVL